MTDELYHQALLAKAKAAAGAGRIESPDASVTLDNPLCGDRVSIDLRLADGRIESLAHRVRGCVLCQAAAAAIAETVSGRPAVAAAEAEAAVRATLAGAPAAEAWRAFAPVAAYKSRHACVLLPFEALRAAIDAARARTG